jgi:hypothetical protein
VELLDLGERARLGLPAVERRHLVPALERGFDQRAADEFRPAEEEQPYWTLQV